MKRSRALAGLAIASAVVGGLVLLALQRGRERVEHSGPTASPARVPPPAITELEENAARDAARLPVTATPEPPAKGPGKAGSPMPADTTRARPRFRIEGRVLTDDGEPIEGADVCAPDGAVLARSDRAGVVDEEVDLEAPEVAQVVDGFADFSVVAEGHEMVQLRVVGMSDRIRAGQIVRLGTVRLGPGSEITGRVVDEEGRPIPDADVSWRSVTDLPEDEAEGRWSGVPNHRREGVPRDSTARDGTFRLRGAPEGEAFLVGWAVGKRFDWTETFTVRAGAPVHRDLTLVETGERTWTLTGRVLVPGGAALPGATVSLRDAGARPGTPQARRWSVTHDTDADGRFEIRLSGDEPRTVEARDPERRWYPARIETVEPLDQEIALVLGAPEWLEVVVADQEGSPIPWSNVRCDSSDEPGGPLVPAGEEGRVTILRPRAPFRLEAFAPGYRTETFGPFEPRVAKGPLVLRLTPGQAVRGRVTFGGKPVPGAHVGVSTTGPPGRVLASAGVTSLEHRFHASGTTELGRYDATTDAEGRFLVTLHQDGWHSVRVEHERFPLQVFGPFEWTTEQGADGLELELRQGGAIDGRLLTAPGVSPAGRVVGAGDRWNVVHSANTDEAGRYRIEDLAPGEWQVRPLAPPVASLQNYATGQVEETSIAWDCVVRAGETTPYDLDLSTEGTIVLAGRFAWEQGPAHEGRVQLLEDATIVATATLDPDGRFELALSRAGRFRLDVLVDLLVLHQPIELFPGKNEWEAVLPWGSLSFTGSSAALRQERMIACSWTGKDGLTANGWRILEKWGDSASAQWKRLPAGRVRLLRFGEDSRWNDLDTWIPWKEVEVRAGEETVVEVP